ncbi:aminodeoxychorismate synthase component I [Halobacillus campisalis]|uniref:Aminodeoxychorismate synthase component I n=1 Tax=Halobacillus campisalis TaxID=435909 RepID=A0ABW2K037_9BACI|nr:aminodeoxychorismate synthase component I [Halobacillus campisalis]
MNDAHLYFEFEDDNGKKQPMQFTRPSGVITAYSGEEVKAAFRKIERELSIGNYVAGYVSYEAAPAFDGASRVKSGTKWPLLWFGVFKSPLCEELVHENKPYQVSEWNMDGDFDNYSDGLRKIKAAIKKGDTYQVNYTTRLNASFHGDDFAFYKQLVNNQRSRYSAYMNMGEGRRVLSASPELFFRKQEAKLKTKPMKGTARRGVTLETDREQVRTLKESEKERAENLMIVDLLRNDLGKLAVSGTVRTSSLFEVETYPTVHQMTSTIEAEVNRELSFYEIFRALFPCGSITGAPKIRTMDYIADLEASPREIYCGAIGYITPSRDAVFNVPIRTVMLDENQAVYGTGGGVTWDSTPIGEYEEMQTKAQLLTEKRPEFKLLESLKLENGRIPLLENHLNRLEDSASYFNFIFDKNEVITQLNDLVSKHNDGEYKVRLLLSEHGVAELEAIEINEEINEVTCCLAEEPVDERNPFLYHKTTHRSVYDIHKREGAFAALLWNTREELTEFTMANLVVKHQGDFFTPPVQSGLLAGTFREELLKNDRVKEKVLHVKELSSFEEVWMVNGVRGWVKVQLL